MRWYTYVVIGLLLSFPGLAIPACADSPPTCSDPFGIWLFNGDGTDETGQHPCTIHGNASFPATPEGFGLHTMDASGFAEYNPAFAEIPTGRIEFMFQLDEVFEQLAPTYNNPIIFMVANRIGHLVGDFSIRLDPTDGKLWFVQEDPVVSSAWTLKTSKDSWEPGVWFEVVVRWGQWGRDIAVTWPNGTDSASDGFSRPCFSPGATLRTIGYRAGDAPPIGLTIDWLQVCSASTILDLDIKPGSCPNPFNPRSKGVLPAAIPGTSDFDVAQVDIASITLEGVAPVRTNLEDVATPFDGSLCDCHDMGGDGYVDLTLKFDSRELSAALGPVMDGEERELTLTGVLLDGTPFTASDCIVVRAGGRVDMEAVSGGLRAAQPNPFRRTTRISYALSSLSAVRLTVFDASGRSVRDLVNETQATGVYELVWDASDLTPGVYYCRLETGNISHMGRVVILK